MASAPSLAWGPSPAPDPLPDLVLPRALPFGHSGPSELPELTTHLQTASLTARHALSRKNAVLGFAPMGNACSTSITLREKRSGWV